MSTNTVKPPIDLPLLCYRVTMQDESSLLVDATDPDTAMLLAETLTAGQAGDATNIECLDG